jgi:hypothetical protein
VENPIPLDYQYQTPKYYKKGKERITKKQRRKKTRKR